MARAGDPGDFGAFYERTYPVAYRTAWSILRETARADDAVQEAYLLAYRQRAHLRGGALALPWVLQIVVSSALATGSRRCPRPAAVNGTRAAALPEREAARAMAGVSLDSAMRTLDLRSRAAVTLRYYAGLGDAESARALGTSVHGAGVILDRATQRLERELGRPDGTLAPAGEGPHA